VRALPAWLLAAFAALAPIARGEESCPPLPALGAPIDWSARAAAARAAGDTPAELRARAHELRAAARSRTRADAELRAELGALIEAANALPAGDRAEVRIHAARSLEQLGGDAAAAEAARTYLAVGESASGGAAARHASYALGRAGALYRSRGRLAEAESLLRRALFLAAEADAPDALYRWQWELARLQRAQGVDPAALDGLRQAVATLRGLGPGALARDPEEDEEPAALFDELVDALLLRAEQTEDAQALEALLREARDTLEALGANELRDYFRDACLEAQEQVASEAVPGAVVVYPIALDDRLELLVGRAGRLSRRRVDVDRATLEAEIGRLRRGLERRATFAYRAPAERVYDWLVRPLEPVLSQGGVDTVVFVPRGALRTIPPAALRDRETQRYLIERFPVAVTPGLTLTQPRPIARQRAALLAAGVSAAQGRFPELAHVPGELAAVSRSFPAVKLLDAAFSSASLEAQLAERAFDIVHIASHGEFSAEAGSSFVLTHDGPLGMERLSEIVGITRFRERPLELLALSACQTGAGDARAALGLAGVAVRAGARSALATLWSVHDDSTSRLIEVFYAQLREPGVSRAAALQRAQLALLREGPYKHPAYWAPFLLINSWL
jgi:CHAT domain-containing protein